MKSLISKVLNKIVFILIKLNIIKPKSIFYMGGVNYITSTIKCRRRNGITTAIRN